MTNTQEQNIVLLTNLLKPLSKFYEDTDTVEIRMGRSGEVITDRRGIGKQRHEAKDLNIAKIETICKSLSNFRGQQFNADTHPKLSCVLPGGHRFECLLGASVQKHISLAIRCKHHFMPTWEQVGATGKIKEYLIEAINGEKKMVISGSTNTGKTTLANKLLGTIPEDIRVIALEDTPEIDMSRFWDGIGLLAERETTSESGLMNYRQLYDHLMRATPEFPIFGEISTLNAFAALAVLNAGPPSFLCTIHAGSPEQVIHRKFAQNIAWSGESMPDIPEYLTDLVDVIIQIKRSADGWRRITDIFEPINDRYVFKDGKEV